MFPRRGGIWDQDPIIVRDFRVIQKYEREWKDAQSKVSEAQQKLKSGQPTEGGGLGLEDALNAYLEEMGEDTQF